MLNVSITTLRRDGDKILEDVGRDRKPVLVTRYGSPMVYLIDTETYESRQRRISELETEIAGYRASQKDR